MRELHALSRLNGDVRGGEDHLPEHGLHVPAWAPALQETELKAIGSTDPLAYFTEHMPVFVAQARAGAINNVDSYRVAVGASALAIGPKRGQIGVLTSGNFKFIVPEGDRNDHDEHDIIDCPKVCSEMDIVARAREQGFIRIAAFVVAAVTDKKVIKSIIDIDDKLDLEKVPPTLEPCDACIDVFEGTDIVDDNTLVVTVGFASNVYRVQTLGDVKIARGSDDYPSPARTYNPSKEVWLRRKDLYLEDLIKNQRTTEPQRLVQISKDPLRVALAKKALAYPSKLLDAS